MTDPRALYHATIVAHDREPHHHGPLRAATNEATIDNPLCGDQVTIRLQIVDGTIVAAAFEGRGCSLSRAAASMLTERAIGSTIEEMRAFATTVEQFVHSEPDAAIPHALGELEALAGVRAFKSRRVCACLPFRALVAALETG